MIKYYNNFVDWKYLEQFRFERDKPFKIRLRCLLCHKFIKRRVMSWNHSYRCPHCKNDLRSEDSRHITI